MVEWRLTGRQADSGICACNTVLHKQALGSFQASPTHTNEQPEARRGWSLVRGHLASEGLTSIHHAKERMCE